MLYALNRVNPVRETQPIDVLRRGVGPGRDVVAERRLELALGDDLAKRRIVQRRQDPRFVGRATEPLAEGAYPTCGGHDLTTTGALHSPHHHRPA